jgi:hypothetical protein
MDDTDVITTAQLEASYDGWVSSKFQVPPKYDGGKAARIFCCFLFTVIFND